MKSSISFVCQECGYDSPQWLGKCPECGSWNSFKEFQLSSKFKVLASRRSGQSSKLRETEKIEPKTLSQIYYTEKERLSTGFLEMNSVLGGGIVAGSVILLAGDPGIGKSTLLLQVGLNLAKLGAEVANDSIKGSSTPVKQANSGFVLRSANAHSENFVSSPRLVLYISGEESEEQIKLRATRLNPKYSSSAKQNFLLLSASNIDSIVQVIEETKPALVIIDSIQTMESENAGGLSGSISQIRYAASTFIKVAKTLKIPFIIVGHVTKEGMVAGPMTLSHMVDTVLFLEGEKITQTRILRSFKNRFGPVDEVGIFAMAEAGMVELKNPEHIFLSEKQKSVPGSVLVATLEGTRAFLVELQGLAVFSKLPYPRRVVSGVDARRVELLLAVMQKHAKLPVETMDIFINVAGGLRVNDPAVDLGICLALFSSLKNTPLGKTVAISEVGLLGELRQVPFLDKRIKEAKKLGYNHVISSKTHRSLIEVVKSIS